jgi:hypothetical protein
LTLLISKVQYKRSERGEFHEIAERDLNDTISLIRNYPWDTERSLASIELTCPSVTLEHPIGTYLKLGPYFSGKFSLYYLNTDSRVYLKTVTTLEEASAYIKTFFEQGKLQGFEKYSFTMRAASHFRTNSFEYTVNTKAIINFLMFPIYMAPIIFLLVWIKKLERPENFRSLDPAVFTVSFLLLFTGPLFYLFFNYLSADKDAYLQISRGHDEFAFGSADNKALFNKQDIAEINGYGIRYSRSPWREAEVFIITFKGGDQIQFTSLLISGNMLRRKLPNHEVKDNKKFFPTIATVG